MRDFELHRDYAPAENHLPSDIMPMFLYSHGALIATVIAVTALSDFNTARAITDFYRNFIEGAKYDPKSLMYITGLGCTIIYFFMYYFYLCSYIEKIWNPFFAQKS